MIRISKSYHSPQCAFWNLVSLESVFWKIQVGWESLVWLLMVCRHLLTVEGGWDSGRDGGEHHVSVRWWNQTSGTHANLFCLLLTRRLPWNYHTSAIRQAVLSCSSIMHVAVWICHEYLPGSIIFKLLLGFVLILSIRHERSPLFVVVMYYNLVFILLQVVCEFDWQFDEFEVRFTIFIFHVLVSSLYCIKCMQQHIQGLSYYLSLNVHTPGAV